MVLSTLLATSPEILCRTVSSGQARLAIKPLKLAKAIILACLRASQEAV